MAADLVLFDPGTVRERVTIDDPHAISVGIRTVCVNGAIVFDDGRPTGAFPGRALRRTAFAVPAAALDAPIDAFARAPCPPPHTPQPVRAVSPRGDADTDEERTTGHARRNVFER